MTTKYNKMNKGEELMRWKYVPTSARISIVDYEGRGFDKTPSIFYSQIGGHADPKTFHIFHGARVINKLQLDRTGYQVFITRSNTRTQAKKRFIIKQCSVLLSDH